MVRIYCAVEGCWGSKGSKHRFPDPTKYLPLLNKWVKLCNNKRLLEVTPAKIYSNYRVCNIHFTASDFASNNRLNRQAIPSKFLPEGIEAERASPLFVEISMDGVDVLNMLPETSDSSPDV